MMKRRHSASTVQGMSPFLYSDIRVEEGGGGRIQVVCMSCYLTIRTCLQEELDVDLVMLNPEADPPLVRLVELNKLKYEQNKANKDQRKKQRENRWVGPS